MFRYRFTIGSLGVVSGLVTAAALAADTPLSPEPRAPVSALTRAPQKNLPSTPFSSPRVSAAPLEGRDTTAKSNSPVDSVSTTPVSTAPLAGIDLSKMERRGEKYVQQFEDKTVYFTVQSDLQQYADSLFEQYEVPAGAAVILNSRTGRVITLSQQRRDPNAADSLWVALDPSPPAASLFKIVTTAALMEKGELSLSHQTCYAGGSSRLVMRHLLDPPPKNHACVSLTTALGSSVNAVFAKLSDRHLDRTILSTYAERFGFNREIGFDVPVKVSKADIPKERLERARTAAGFWHTHISPLHAAAIAQSLAQNGAMLKPYIVDRVETADGQVVYKSSTKYLGHTVSKETASSMTKAMVYTTERGTARKSFRDRRGRRFLPSVDVSGKTGTLTGQKPYRAYTWFVGTAPADRPKIAIAVLVVNEPKWRIKAPQMAAMLLKKYFDTKD